MKSQRISEGTKAIFERLPADGSWMKYWDWRHAREKGFVHRQRALKRAGLIEETWDEQEGSMYRRAREQS